MAKEVSGICDKAFSLLPRYDRLQRQEYTEQDRFDQFPQGRNSGLKRCEFRLVLTDSTSRTVRKIIFVEKQVVFSSELSELCGGEG